MKGVLKALFSFVEEAYEKASSAEVYEAADKLAAKDDNNAGIDDWLARRLRNVGDALKAVGK